VVKPVTSHQLAPLGVAVTVALDSIEESMSPLLSEYRSQTTSDDPSEPVVALTRNKNLLSVLATGSTNEHAQREAPAAPDIAVEVLEVKLTGE
jgi:hypothetical protein